MEGHPASFKTEETTTFRHKEATPFASLAETLPHIKIAHTDLLQLGFAEDEIARLSHQDLTAIARTMREHLIHEWLPQELHFHVMEHLYNPEQSA